MFDEPVSQPTEETLIYRSSNGDAWFLTRNPTTGDPAIKHIPNPSSGGQNSFLEIASFLSTGANGPEHQALRLLMETSRLTTVLITYDIHPAHGPSYDQLGKAIQSLGAWWHHLETVWIVRSSHTLAEIKDALKLYVGTDDQLLVVDITGDNTEWVGISDAGSKWLKESLGAS